VLLTTHHMEEAEALASRVVVMNRGRVVRQGSAAEIRRGAGLRRVAYVDSSGTKVVLRTQDSDAAVCELVRSGVAFHDLSITEQSLEDAVLSLLEEPV
jgi:ABC-2 type transport system ATP-binding protein